MKRILLFEQHITVNKDPIFLYCKSEHYKNLLGDKRSSNLFNLMKTHKGVGYDFFNNKLEAAPLKEGQTSGKVVLENKDISPNSLENKVYLSTNKVSSNYKYLNSYVEGKGWLKVWEEKSKPGETTSLTKNYDTKLFELGKFKIGNDFKKTLEKDIDEVLSTSTIIEVMIQSSTDKTPLTPQLKKELEGLGYTQDNEGLSKARANQISSILIEKNIPKEKIKTENLFEQGSAPKSEEERLKLVRSKEGYDPSARFVNIIYKVKSKGGEDFYYFQKVLFPSKGGKIKRTFLFDDGVCDDESCGTYQ